MNYCRAHFAVGMLNFLHVNEDSISTTLLSVLRVISASSAQRTNHARLVGTVVRHCRVKAMSRHSTKRKAERRDEYRRQGR